jgi:hypothetical protein
VSSVIISAYSSEAAVTNTAELLDVAGLVLVGSGGAVSLLRDAGLGLLVKYVAARILVVEPLPGELTTV